MKGDEAVERTMGGAGTLLRSAPPPTLQIPESSIASVLEELRSVSTIRGEQLRDASGRPTSVAAEASSAAYDAILGRAPATEPRADKRAAAAGHKPPPRGRRRAKPGSPFASEAVQDYLRRAAETPLLTADEEVMLARRIEAGVLAQERLDAVTPADSRRFRRELWTLVQAGREAKEHFILANLRLVVSIAKHHLGRGLELLDVIQEGNIGLNRAVEKFDYRMGHKFSTYATWWIRQAITRALGDQSRMIRVPVHAHEKYQAVDRARRVAGLDWADLLRRGVTSIADEAEGLDESELLRAWQASVPPLSLEAIDDRGYDIIDDAELIDDLLLHEAQTGLTRELLDEVVAVDWRAADILRRRCGFDGEPQTLDEIGRHYGVTRERIRQIEAKALKWLRAGFGRAGDASVPCSTPLWAADEAMILL